MYGRPLDEIDWNRVAPDAIALFGDAEGDGVESGPDRTPLLEAQRFHRVVCARTDAPAGAALHPRQPGLPAADSHGRVCDQPVRPCAVVVPSRRRATRQAPSRRLDWHDVAVGRPDDPAPADRLATDRRGAIQSVCFDPVSGVLGAIVCRLSTEADADARRAAPLQRHQFGRRRHAGVRPRQVDAAGALVGVPRSGRRAGSGRLHVMSGRTAA